MNEGNEQLQEILQWIKDDPEGVARSLIAAQEAIDRLSPDAERVRR